VTFHYLKRHRKLKHQSKISLKNGLSLKIYIHRQSVKFNAAKIRESLLNFFRDLFIKSSQINMEK
jgi:hypothetical protein